MIVYGSFVIAERDGRSARSRRFAGCGAALLLLLVACGDVEHAPIRFVDRTEEAGIAFRMSFLPGEQGEKFKINLYDHGSGVAAGDIDGDGDDDLYFLNQLGANGLYRNNGDGTFTDVTAAAGPVALADRICTAAAFNDIDNDGDQDLYVTSTRGGNALFRNDGKGVFVDVTAAAGNARPDLFVNRGPRRNYLAFRLEGTRSNRDAIGAVVRVFLGDRVLVRQVQAAGGYLAQSSKTVHFGLGGATSVDRCEIRWPAGTVQVIDAPKVNRLHAIREPVK